MKGSTDIAFKNALKKLIIDACDLADRFEIGDIEDTVPLFGRSTKLELDSIDALQISIAVQQEYGVAITDSKQMRRVMTSINTFADFLRQEKPS
jgi:acyl carrier protein